MKPKRWVTARTPESLELPGMTSRDCREVTLLLAAPKELIEHPSLVVACDSV